MSTTDVEQAALVKSLIAQARRLGLTWTLRNATVIDGSNPTQVTVQFDGDTSTSYDLVSTIGKIAIAQRVVVMSIPPAGQFIIGYAGNDPWRPISAHKDFSTSRSNNITLTADPDLVVTVPANTAWIFRIVIYHASQAAAAGDLSFNISWSSTPEVSASIHGLAAGLASGVTGSLTAGQTTRVNTTSPSVTWSVGCSPSGMITTVEGRVSTINSAAVAVLTLNWAQRVTNANTTSVLNGSNWTLWRIA